MLGTMTIFTPFSKLIFHLMANTSSIINQLEGSANGKLATDITADTMVFTAYPPTYLSSQASGKNLLIGANFASAGSGYDDKSTFLSAKVENLSLEERRLDEQIREMQERLRELSENENNQNGYLSLKMTSKAYHASRMKP